MKRKILIIFLSIVCAACLAVGLTACGGGETQDAPAGETETPDDGGSTGGDTHTHSLTKTEAKAATCGANGNTEYWYCSGCGKYFSDSNGTNEITLASTVISATGEHTYEGSYTCSVCGYQLNASEGLAYTLSDDCQSYTVTGIGGCTDTEIVVPYTYNGLPVTAIGDEAFMYAEVTSFTLPESITSIGYYAFIGSEYYDNEDNWEDGALYIGSCLIEANGVSGDYTVKDGTTVIADWAFWGCTALSITIPEGVTAIGEYAFSRCTVLTSVTFGENSQLASIGSSAFSYCTSLTNITIPDSVTSIGEGAFYGCTSLVSVTIPDSVTYIGWFAFEGCTSLVSVTIPDSVTYIADEAFYECTALTTVYYNGTVDEWNEISIGLSNTYLTSATIYYYSETEPDYTDGCDYWHYVNGEIVVWAQ